MFAVLLGASATVLLAAQASRTLLVAGHSGTIDVVEMGGRSYVEIEALTRLANGSLSFKGNQIVLSLSSPNTTAATMAGTAANANMPVPTPSSGFSKEFVKAGIEQMSVIREWRRALISAVQRGFPITADWMTSFSDQAQQNLRLTAVAASTDSDKNALQLLTNVFSNMKTLSDRFVGMNNSRTYIPTDALDNDPLEQGILACGRSLAAMAASDQFFDDGSCH